MSSKITTMSIIFLCLFSGAGLAVDNPQDAMGSEKFDSMKCITENAETCINSICLNSDQVDCQDNCQKTAQEKCQQQSNE